MSNYGIQSTVLRDFTNLSKTNNTQDTNKVLTEDQNFDTVTNTSEGCIDSCITWAVS